MKNSKEVLREDEQGLKPVFHLQHNVANLIYCIKNLIQEYFSKAEGSGFKDEAEALGAARESLRKIHELASRVYAITKRIRVAMRAQRVEGESLEFVSVSQVWREVIEILEKRFSFQRIELIEHVPPEFPLIECRKSELFEIFYYLAQNATQAMKRRGKLIIRANREFRAGDKASAVITISDTGPGIPEAVLTQLFEPFFTTKSLEEGNGLGLCLVRSLVKRNRGIVSVSSFEGCGTTFTLSFNSASCGGFEKNL